MRKVLSQLLPAFEHKIVAVDGSLIQDLSEINNIPITNLVFDSREVKYDSLFFALPGIHTDGNNFIEQAILTGANVVVFQGELSPSQQDSIAKAIVKRSLENALSNDVFKFSPVLIKVPDSRFAMAPISACFFDNPSERLIVIGVTGTEGKSSTVSFIWQLLKACNLKAGFISTVEYSFGDEALANPQHQTTPEAPIIQHHLNKMLENGCKYAVIESSSHGLSSKLNRCGNIIFDCSVFMNVTLEHLEFHKNFESYRSDKANLFRALDKYSHTKFIGGERISIKTCGIVNLEDPSASYFANSTKQKVYGFTSLGKAGKAASEEKELPAIPEGIESYLMAENILSTANNLSFDIVFKDKNNENLKINIDSQLPGAFNAYNLMACLLACHNVTGIDYQILCQKIKELKPIKGRMTKISQNQPFEVIIDYAHTPSSFETIFPPLRNRCTGKMICLFGSGGERDLTKRPLQGEIAAKYCDIVILTDEDPRGEDPLELLKMIAEGSISKGKVLDKDLFIIPNRPQAIRFAFKLADKNDIVLLLGKSHENSIIYKDFVMPYDEIAEAKKALNEMNY